jgi:hypothetical protein
MDTESVPALTGALEDPAEEVRVQALHALACDRCTAGSCRSAAASALPAAAALRGDASARVRAMAVELIGTWVHAHPDAAVALESAASSDTCPAAGKKASWPAPGGTIYRGTRRSRLKLAWCTLWQ